MVQTTMHREMVSVEDLNEIINSFVTKAQNSCHYIIIEGSKFSITQATSKENAVRLGGLDAMFHQHRPSNKEKTISRLAKVYYGSAIIIDKGEVYYYLKAHDQWYDFDEMPEKFLKFLPNDINIIKDRFKKTFALAEAH